MPVMGCLQRQRTVQHSAVGRSRPPASRQYRCGSDRRRPAGPLQPAGFRPPASCSGGHGTAGTVQIYESSIVDGRKATGTAGVVAEEGEVGCCRCRIDDWLHLAGRAFTYDSQVSTAAPVPDLDERREGATEQESERTGRCPAGRYQYGRPAHQKLGQG